MALSEMLADVAFFGRTDDSYAFIVDPKGRLLMHPLLPSPDSVSSDPIFLQATSLETAPDASEVLQSMLR
jgi:poly [ADP-ribose] polymerase